MLILEHFSKIKLGHCNFKNSLVQKDTKETRETEATGI